MIHKQIMYGSCMVVMAEFKGGTIAVANTANEDHVAIVMKSIEPSEIGAHISNHKKGDSSDSFQPELVMVFNNPKSIDVVVEFLLKAKSHLETLNISMESSHKEGMEQVSNMNLPEGKIGDPAQKLTDFGADSGKVESEHRLPE